MNKPVLTLILPSYNVADYIRECLESALTQTLSGLELLCVDAASGDDTAAILKEYEERCLAGEWPGKKLQVLTSDRRSYGYQVNMGLSHAKGDYLAILETDDYVVPQMYEELLGPAIAMDLDYIRGEYDFFTTGPDGVRSFKHVHHYAPVNVLLTDTRSERIMTYDQNLWKGIYRREFLLDNHIRLNESDGAAFQDIGFNMQVFSYAKRAYYTDRSYYRYRRDRNESSIHSLECFRFYAQELAFLHTLDPACDRLYWPGIYERFACALSGELSKAASQFNTLPDDPRIAPYLASLTEDFATALAKGLWPAPTTPRGQLRSIRRILEDPMAFALSYR